MTTKLGFAPLSSGIKTLRWLVVRDPVDVPASPQGFRFLRHRKVFL
jgi:hypothetical protein